MEFPANERLGVGIARMAMDVGHVASSGDTHLAIGTLSTGRLRPIEAAEVWHP